MVVMHHNTLGVTVIYYTRPATGTIFVEVRQVGFFMYAIEEEPDRSCRRFSASGQEEILGFSECRQELKKLKSLFESDESRNEEDHNRS